MKQQIPNTTWGLEVDTVSRWAYAEGLFTNEECDQIIKLGYEYELTKSVTCLLYTSPSPRDGLLSRMPSSA